MSSYVGTGTHRIGYKAVSFGTGKTVTAYIWSPANAKSDLQTFTELSDGLYYLDYAFAALGTYLCKLYEGGTGTTFATFRIISSPFKPATDTLEGAYTYDQLFRLWQAALAGESSGGGTGTMTFRDAADSKARITATLDDNGNRTEITLDGD